MQPTQQLHDLGQSLWLDNITRGHLVNGILRQLSNRVTVECRRCSKNAGSNARRSQDSGSDRNLSGQPSGLGKLVQLTCV